MVLTEDYSVRLDRFAGPLDLLLHLIRRAEIDISTISLAQITNQYLEFLKGVRSIDVEPAGEFLVTAATLIELKSRLLAPIPPSEDETAGGAAEAPAGDLASDLVRALMEYKRFREAAEMLDARRRAWEDRWPTRPPAAPVRTALEEEPPGALDLEDLSLFDLAQAYARIAETVNFERVGRHAVVDDDTPIELHAADILDRLRGAAAGGEGIERPIMPLRSIFAGRNRSEVIGLFLAVLELVRQRAVKVRQAQASDEVTIELGEPDADPTPTGPDAVQP